MQSSSNHYKNKFPQVGLALVLGFVLLVEDIAFMLFASQQLQQSGSLLSLYAISISTILTLWVHYDSRSLGISMGMDQSMYIFWGWPIMFPVYAFRSRGFRSGGLLLLLFLGIIIFTFIAAFVITMAINIGIAIFSAGQ
jgi:hypothetical protein